MYNVTQDFKNAVESVSRKIRGKVYISDYYRIINDEKVYSNDYFLDDTYLQSIEIERGTQTESSFIGNTISKKYIIKIIDTDRELHFEEARVVPHLGIMLESETEEFPEYVPFAPADVYTAEFDTVSKVWTLTCYDDMQKLSEHQIGELGSIEPNEFTFKGYLQEIFTLTELELEDANFYLYDENLDSGPNLSGQETFREVVGHLAEACLCNAVINRNGKLELVNAVSDSVVKTITADHFYQCKIDSYFGPINSVVLSRYPQEDNVYASDDDSITADGLTELRIENNAFLDRISESGDTRYDYNNDLLAASMDYDHDGDPLTDTVGFGYYAYSLEWRGDPSLDEGDCIEIVDAYNKTYKTHYYNDKIIFTGGLKSTSEVSIILQESTNYETASSIKSILKNAILQVDKINNNISSTVQSIENVNNDISDTNDTVDSNKADYLDKITSVIQTATDISQSVTQAGGLNTIKNSLFLENAEGWDVSSGTSFQTIQDTDVEKNTDSGSELLIASGALSQQFYTTIGEYYTLAFKYKKEAIVPGNTSYVKLYFNGVPEDILTVAEEIDDRTEFYYTYESTSEQIILEISTESDNFYITDLRNIKGDKKSPWSQHKNEVYGKGTILNSKGLTIKDANELADVFIHADNNSITIENGTEIFSELSEEKVAAPKAEIQGDIQLDEIVVSHLTPSRIIIARGE